MTYRSVSCNVANPQTAANNKTTIMKATSVADVVSFQEADEPSSRLVLQSVPGFDVYLPTGLAAYNPIIWRRSVMRQFDDPGWAAIMKNIPGVADGPDRCMTWVPLEEILTERRVLEVCAHMIAKAWTSHKERQPQWLDSIKKLADVCNILIDKYPNIPLVIKGDWNRGGAWEIPALLEQEIQTPATFAGARYDRFFLVGGAQGSDPIDIDVPSDHDVLKVDITLLPQPKPKTVLEIAEEVLAGTWGNGPERKAALEKAGYNYVAVQKAVVDLLDTSNQIKAFRAKVDEAMAMPFPTLTQDPKAVAMKTAIAAALKAGPVD